MGLGGQAGLQKISNAFVKSDRPRFKVVQEEEMGGERQEVTFGGQGRNLDGVLDLLLELVRDVVAVSDVANPRQRSGLHKLLCEGRQPTPRTPTPHQSWPLQQLQMRM